MNRFRSSFARARFAALGFAMFVAAGCSSPVQKGFEVHTPQLTCAEANQYVYDTVVDLDMNVTEFRKARPGSPGYIAASGGGKSGSVDIRCDAAGVHIDPKQGGVGGDTWFDRAVFLGVTGRSRLVIDRGQVVGRRAPDGSIAEAPKPGDSAAVVAAASAPPPVAAPKYDGFRVTMEPQLGFGTVLDFEADISAAGILPIRVTISNGTRNSYEIDPRDVVVRVRDERRKANSLSAAEAVGRLEAHAAEVGASSVGDVPAATRILRERELGADRLGPAEKVTGYIYYPTGDYDRARFVVTEVSTGEAEGFLIEF